MKTTKKPSKKILAAMKRNGDLRDAIAAATVGLSPADADAIAAEMTLAQAKATYGK